MRIFTAQMLSNKRSDQNRVNIHDQHSLRSRHGFVLVELIMVVTILGLMAAVTTLALSSMFTRNKIKEEVQELTRTLEMAHSAAVESNGRYAVIIDLIEQTYTLRQYSSLQMDVLTDEEAILKTGQFSEHCYLEYVYFDDGTDTRNPGPNQIADEAIFFAGRIGWMNGAKIGLLDTDGNPHTIIINRILGKVTYTEGDVDILVPQSRQDVPF